MVELKQSTAATVIMGAFVDDTDGKTPETALTLSQSDCLISKNGGATAQKNDASSASHIAGGHYGVPLSTTDTGTLGTLRIIINESGALPVWQDFGVIAAAVWDAKYGSGNLPANIKAISDDATAADNAESFFDGTGYAGTNNVIPSVTTVATTTTVTNMVTANMTQVSGDATAADNLEAQYDGTGYVNSNAPAYQAQISALGGALAIHENIDTSTVINGTASGAISEMNVDDNVRYVVTANAGTGALEFILKCSPTDTSSFPVELHCHGFYDEAVGATNGCRIQVYDFQAAAWTILDTMTNAGADQTRDLSLVSTNSCPSATTIETVAVVPGDVLIKFTQVTNEIASTVNLDHLTVGFVGSGLTAINVWTYADRQLTALDEDVTTLDLNNTAIGSVVGAVGSVTGAVGSVTGNVGGNVTGSVGSVASGGITAASIATGAIDSDAIDGTAVTELQAGLATATALSTVSGLVDDLETRLTAGRAANLDNLNATITSRASQTSVDTVDDYLDTEIAAIKLKTDNLPASPAATGDIPTVIQIRTEMDANSTKLANLDATVTSRASQTSVNTIDDFVDTEVGAIKTVTDKLDTAVELDGAVYRFTANALEQAPTGGAAPTVGQIADAVWDEAIAGHLGVGSAGATLNGATAPSAGVVADAVWDEALAGHAGAGSAGAALSAAGASADPLLNPVPGAYAAGTAGWVLGRLEPGAGALEFTYTLTNATTFLPEPNALVEFCTDAARLNVVWRGYTDSFGVARDTSNNKPWLDPGTYYIRVMKGADVNYDTEIVS